MLCLLRKTLIFFSAHLLLILSCVLPTSSKRNDSAYDLLATSIRSRMKYDVKTISSALESLSTTQAALKKIDGTAHEMYQRTHKSSTTFEESDGDDENSSGKIGGLKVEGRMSRNAARVGCVADALFAAELCELASASASAANDKSGDGTLSGWTEREIVFNATINPDESMKDKSSVALSVLVIFEPKYNGGAGVKHGGIEDLLSFAKEEIDDECDSEESSLSSDSKQSDSSPRGRFIIILSDHDATSSKNDLPYIISNLDIPPIRVKLNHQSAVVTVAEPLYLLAGHLIRSVGQVIDMSDNDYTGIDNESSIDSDNGGSTSTKDIDPSKRPAIHIVGHSLSGAVAALAAYILDGSLPMPGIENRKGKLWSGFARDRVSALCLGCPPCISGNEADFVTSIINGDDIVCRSSYKTLQQLYSRTERAVTLGGFFGKGVGLVSDAARLTITGLTSGSAKKKDGYLSVPGRVYLVRPRRIGGGSSSIHEVGGSIGGRGNVRAAVLWQLNDVLLSKSLWKHHTQSSYIRSLDRVQLKGFIDNER